MQIKKNPKVDVQNIRGLLLEIGLAVALLIVIVAFLYTPREYRIEQVDMQVAVVEEEITQRRWTATEPYWWPRQSADAPTPSSG